MRKLTIETLAASAAAMALISFIDAQSSQISFWPLYMGPVVALSWVRGFSSGALAALAAGLLLAVSARFAGHPYANGYFFALATASHVATLLLVAWGANRLAALESVLIKVLGRP